MSSKSEQALEKRTGLDRRQWVCDHPFPYVDTHGYLVTRERRKAPERRRKPSQKD